MDLTPEQEAELQERVDSHVNGTVSELSVMQRRAVAWHLRGRSKTEACRLAGYAHPESQQSRIFSNPAVQDCIEAYLFNEEMDAREVIRLLSQQARAGYAKYFVEREVPVLDNEGELVGHRYEMGVDFERLLADGKGHLVKGVRNTQYGPVIEFHDAQSALVHLGRYHGLFTDRTDLTSGGDRLAQPIIYIPDNGRQTND